MNLSIGFAVTLAAPLALGTVSCRNLVELSADSRWVEHVLAFMHRADTALAALLQAETTVRGHALTEAPTL